jgi:hypothetical protein
MLVTLVFLPSRGYPFSSYPCPRLRESADATEDLHPQASVSSGAAPWSPVATPILDSSVPVLRSLGAPCMDCGRRAEQRNTSPVSHG